MPEFEDTSFSAEEFSGIARLFPLPNLVLFPHVMQPLHIFEPRYRALFREAMATDRLIAMALLAPGWEADYEGRPPLYSTACLGRIAAHQRLADGSYNLLLTGIKRVEIFRELPAVKAFRQAEVRLCEDFYPSESAEAAQDLRRKFREAIMKILPALVKAHSQVAPLTESGVPLGVLTDLVSYMLDIPLADKQALLAERNVHRRAESLLEHLARAAGDTAPAAAGVLGFPPDFSEN
jgi:Lon protease-like protein